MEQRKAMDLVIFWCNEDGDIIIPYSKKQMKYGLEAAGFKKDTINRALSEVNINWNEHALIWARRLKKMGFVKSYIKEYMREIDGFSTDEVKYALDNLETSATTRKNVDPVDFIGMTDAEKIAKLLSLGFNEEQAKQALLFLDSNQ